MHSNQHSDTLGSFSFSKSSFQGLDAAFRTFSEKSFKSLHEEGKVNAVNQILCKLIQEEKEPCFLLRAVIEFIDRVETQKIIPRYTFSSFELWLNQYSGLNGEQNAHIRGKIAGKRIDRDDYQILFPIGMGKVYEGTHFVTAHQSPDLDTTVASFWGWLDAFAARVGDGLHVWNLPGGPPASQIEIEWLFKDLFGASIFTHIPMTRNALNLVGHDLMSQEGLVQMKSSDSMALVDHDRDNKSVVVVDSEGFYLGDWRNVDVEGIQQVIMLLSSALRWFENKLHLQLIASFAKKDLHFTDFKKSLESFFYLKVEEAEPVLEFSSKQKRNVAAFLKQVLGISEGMSVSFDRLLSHLGTLASVSFEHIDTILTHAKKLFSGDKILENRSSIFRFLEKTVGILHDTIFHIRRRLETLDIALKTKEEVFGHEPTFVTLRSDVEEIRNKMGSYVSLTVASSAHDKLIPLGTIHAADLRKNILGTVSLRDFCNREEMSIPSYLQVISVVDHHKSSLNTFSPPMAIIGDVQSSNTLVAGLAFEINDRYSEGGQSLAQIDEQIKKWMKDPSSSASRVLRKLLQRKIVLQKKGHYFIHPEREILEYLHFLHAILDDTDLLSKMSIIDVECVAALLNRLKSLTLKQEVEIISLDDLPRDKVFIKAAVKRILQNADMYSLYGKIYAYREAEVEKNLLLAAKGKESNLFADTKEQNGCCKIGQTKLFSKNIPLFFKEANHIREHWLSSSEKTYLQKSDIKLYLHMISTIVSAEEVYQGLCKKYPHQDELWIWIPEDEAAVEKLKRFLNAFQASLLPVKTSVSLEIVGSKAEDLAMIFKESFFEVPQTKTKGEISFAILRFEASILNSRKAKVTPFLPSA